MLLQKKLKEGNFWLLKDVPERTNGLKANTEGGKQQK